MFEDLTFENIMERCLARLPDSIDKREGSIIYDAIAPAAAELAIMYIELAYLMDRAFPDTAAGDDLTRKCQERGVSRYAATHAVREGAFAKADGSACDVPIGARFSGGGLNFAVTGKIDGGRYKLTAEAAGRDGNAYTGPLLPVDYVQDLAAASLSTVLLPGEDTEDDESLRARYYASLEMQSFGGNKADYKEKVGRLQGVGAVKVNPVWDGGGTVNIIFVGSDWGVPSAEVVKSVQDAVDPTPTGGQGDGIAPVGHLVTVYAATGVKVNVSFSLSLSAGVSWDGIRAEVESALRAYFAELARGWADSEALVVRLSQVESKLLNVAGVIDVTKTTLNGQPQNLTLAAEAIPVLGEVRNAAS